MTEKTDGPKILRVNFKPSSPKREDEIRYISAEHAGFVENLYRNHWRELCGSLRRIYGSGPPEPEDLAQAAFTKITQLDRFDHIENPKAFLYKVAINIALKSVGRIVRTRAFIAQQLENSDVEMKEISPERIYEDREQLGAVENAMKKLTPKQREIVVRSRIKGETYAEISAAKGWSQAQISRQLKVALAILERAYDEAKDEGTEATGMTNE